MRKLLFAVIMTVVIVSLVPVVASANNDVTSGTTTSVPADPSEPPLPAPPVDPPHKPVTYTVQAGLYIKDHDTKQTFSWPEDLSLIAAKENLTQDEIKASNPSYDFSNMKVGDSLTLPPIHGIVYTVQDGDILTWISYSYQVDVNDVISYNSMSDPDNISPGLVLIIPGAKLPARPIPQPTYYQPVATANTSPGASPPVGPVSVGAIGNHFSFGYCTYWVASKRPIPWFGDAWAWWGNARAYGFSEGSTPRVGAVMVTWEGPVGHVAYVESVSGSSWTVSEMNYRAWNVVDYRTISAGSIPLVGFIY